MSNRFTFPRPNLQAAQRQLTVLQRRLPNRIGNLALKHFLQSFRTQGFTNRTLAAWPSTAKKKNTPGKKSTGILIGSGALRASGHVVQADMNHISIGFGNQKVPYAQTHNEGFTGTVTVKQHERTKIIRARVRGAFAGTARRNKTRIVEISGAAHVVKSHTRSMKLPRRQFMGISTHLNEQIDNTIREELTAMEQAAFNHLR
jgi:phage gpG-like protein